MTRCNDRTRNFIWMTKSVNRGFSQALVDLEREPNLSDEERDLVYTFKQRWLSGKDVHRTNCDLLPAFEQACLRHAVRINCKVRCKLDKNDPDLAAYHRTVERYPSGRPKHPYSPMYDSEWSGPSEEGSYWPPFSTGKGPYKVSLSPAERRAIVAEFRAEAMRKHLDRIAKPKKGKAAKRRLIPGKLLATDSVIAAIPWTISGDIVWANPRTTSFAYRPRVAMNQNEKVAA